MVDFASIAVEERNRSRPCCPAARVPNNLVADAEGAAARLMHRRVNAFISKPFRPGGRRRAGMRLPACRHGGP
jgi:hypothetical protein